MSLQSFAFVLLFVNTLKILQVIIISSTTRLIRSQSEYKNTSYQNKIYIYISILSLVFDTVPTVIPHICQIVWLLEWVHLDISINGDIKEQNMEVRNHIDADKVMKRPIFDPLELKEKAKRSDDVSSDV